MTTVALHTLLQDGREGDYDIAHRRIPDELAAAMTEVGIRQWRIWRSGPDVFHLVEFDDAVADPWHALNALARSPADASWQLQLAGLVRGHANRNPGSGLGLPLVWSLADQRAVAESDESGKDG
jgi:L-rhamnose mutarotase